jgi:diacylglycerol kinase (ATP)
LNSGPPVPQTGALTGLRYAPKLRPDYSEVLPKAQQRSLSGPLSRMVPRAARRCNTLSGAPVKRLYSATLNSLRGLGYCLRYEAAVREEAVLFIIALPLGFFLAPSPSWYVAMIGSLLALLAIELLNTAVEKLADFITLERHVEIRRVKDFGSAAVFCALGLVGLIWLAAAVLRLGFL